MRGKIIRNGVVLKIHEEVTIRKLLKDGFCLELIRAGLINGEKTADFRMNGEEWEMKCPKGGGRWVIKNNIQDGSHQARNIILDFYRLKRNENRAIGEAELIFQRSKYLRKMIIYRKSGERIDWKK